MRLTSAANTLVRDIYRKATLKRLYPDRYRAAARQDVRPGSVVFLEIRSKTLSDNFRLIRSALEHRNAAGTQEEPAVRYHISVISIQEGMENRAVVVQNCLEAIPTLAQAQFIFVNESSYFLSCLPIRSETTVIQTWHACGAFKKFGFSAVGKGFGTTRHDLEQYPVHGNFSYVTVSSPEVVWAYAEAFHMEDRRDRILPIGVSRTDLFFSRKYRERACEKVTWILRRMAPGLFLSNSAAQTSASLSNKHAYAGLQDVYTDRAEGKNDSLWQEIVPGRKVLLYAPTFRGKVGSASSPDRLDIPMMKRVLGDRYILLVNHHPFVKEKDRPKIPENCRDFAFDVTDRLSIEELLTAADVCITDYSSLVFEYSLFEKPILFFTYDMQEYLDERGFYYPIREMMPGPVCSTTQELTEVLKTPDAEFNLLRVREFKYRFMSGCDGHATARILQLMDRVAKEKNPMR